MALYIAAKLSPEDRKSFVDWVTRPVLRVLRSDLLKSASHQVDRVHPLSNPNTNSDSGESTGVARSPYVAPAGLPNVRLGNHLGGFKSKKGKRRAVGISSTSGSISQPSTASTIVIAVEIPTAQPTRVASEMTAAGSSQA